MLVYIYKYPHAESNTSTHQAPGIVTGQLLRFRNIINTVTAFKEATTKLVVQMLKRKHSTIQIYKGWENHLKRFQGDRYMNNDRQRIWFRQMVNWAFHHCKEKNTIQILGWQSGVRRMSFPNIMRQNTAFIVRAYAAFTRMRKIE